LEPAARPAAEIDDALASLEDPMLRLDLEQLVRRSRAIALALRA
jgi:hypothetical protein